MKPIRASLPFRVSDVTNDGHWHLKLEIGEGTNMVLHIADELFASDVRPAINIGDEIELIVVLPVEHTVLAV